MIHKVSILWGEQPHEGDIAKTYEFKTKEELEAFHLGIAEMDGWLGHYEVEEGYIHNGRTEDLW